VISALPIKYFHASGKQVRGRDFTTYQTRLAHPFITSGSESSARFKLFVVISGHQKYRFALQQRFK
jgi:hypothetical protein